MQNFLQPNSDLQNASNLFGKKKISTINKKMSCGGDRQITNAQT